MAALSAAGSTVPGSLLSQYKLLRAVIDAPWATRLDHKVISHVIDRYFVKFGNARASLRYLEVATGAERNKIIPSLRRLIENGVISIIRQGIGTRPTEYDLNFEFVASGALEGTSTSGAPEGTSSGAPEGTSTDASGAHGGTESYLRNMPTGMLTVSRNEDAPAGPTAPPVSGLEAHTAVTAVDPEKVGTPVGFQELWAVWPRKHHIAKARAAYKALTPDTTLHATLVTKATQWATHYEQTATEKKWWKHLHTWLAEERYLEDVPQPYENPKEAAIAKARQNGPRKTISPERAAVKATGLSPKTPLGRHKVKVVSGEMPDVGPEQRMIFKFRIEDGEHNGKEFSHTFKYGSDDDEERLRGSETFAELRHATGILEPEDTSDFVGKPLLAIVKAMGRIEYAAM